MPADFEDFARAASRSRSDAVAPVPPLSQVAVLGGGADARLLAALALGAGYQASYRSA